MGQEEMQQLADRLMAEPALREQFRQDPQAAAEAAGITLDEGDREGLRSSEWQDLADAELTERISKGRYG